MSRFIFLLAFVVHSLSISVGQNSWLIWTEHPLTQEHINAFKNTFSDSFEVKKIGKSFNIYKITLRESSFSRASIIRALQSFDFIQALSPDVKVDLRNSNDPELNNQWHLQDMQYAIKATTAWNVMQPRMRPDTFVIAIIDAGFDTLHEDILYALNFKDTLDGIDNDSNGFVDDFRGWNFETNSPIVSSHWHGTMVAGTSGAITDNGIGVASPPLNIARIFPIVVGNPYNDSVLLSRIIQAYDYVYTMRLMWDTSNGTVGLPIVATNLSMGIDGASPSDYPLWCQIYDSLGKLGILNVAATSNNIVNVDSVGDMPTTCPSRWLISVTATDQNGSLAGAYGKTHIDVAAPGTGIYSTWTGNSYSYSSGTSFAAPQVSSMVPIVLSLIPDSIYNDYWQNPSNTSLLIKRFIMKGITRYADSRPTQTNGIINMNLLVQMSISADTTIVSVPIPHQETDSHNNYTVISLDGKIITPSQLRYYPAPYIAIINGKKVLVPHYQSSSMKK